MAFKQQPTVTPLSTWGMLAGALGLGWGFLAVWIPHEAAGLAVLGVDFLTYIKLLPRVFMPGVLYMSWPWCLPLLTASVTVSQFTWSRNVGLTGSPVLTWCVRLALTGMALYFCLHILPLDWSPANLLWPSNRVQTVLFCIGTGIAVIGPLSGTIFMQRVHWWLPLMALGSLATVPAAFFVFLPVFSQLYGQPLMPGPWILTYPSSVPYG